MRIHQIKLVFGALSVEEYFPCKIPLILDNVFQSNFSIIKKLPYKTDNFYLNEAVLRDRHMFNYLADLK